MFCTSYMNVYVYTVYNRICVYIMIYVYIYTHVYSIYVFINIYIYVYTCIFFKEVEVDGKTTSWKNSSQERSTALSTEEMALTADQRAETWRKQDLR